MAFTSVAPRTRRSAEEATRGALLAVHSAASFSRRKEAVSLLRSAEGMVRAALAQLRCPLPAPGGAAPTASSRRRRRRKAAADSCQVSKGISGDEKVEQDEAMISDAVDAGSDVAGHVDSYMDGGELLFPSSGAGRRAAIATSSASSAPTVKASVNSLEDVQRLAQVAGPEATATFEQLLTLTGGSGTAGKKGKSSGRSRRAKT